MAIAMTTPERRRAPRIQLGKIAYLNFDERNGGIILNVSQGGLCFHSIAPVHKPGIVRFWLGQHGERIEGEGRLVWTDDSHKRGGLCFANMSAEARDKLFDVISEPAAPVVASTAAKHQSAKPRERGVMRIKVSSAHVIQLFRGFSGGLASGLVISALIAGAFMSHRQLGEFLVRLGEHLGANPAAPTQPVLQTQTEIGPPMQKQVVPPTPPPTERRRSAAPAAVLAEQVDSLLVVPRLATQDKSQLEGIGPKPAVDVTVPVGNGASAKPVIPNSAATLSAPPMIFLPKAPIATPPAVLPDKSVTILPPRPASQTVVKAESSRPMGSGAIEQMYFEVGKFKEQLRAKEETDKLAKLGFPATVLQKGRLWMNSYRVLVGPYHESDEAESAHKDLVARGFEARPFERGSRNFVLPARLTWHGTQVPGGDCAIKWESYIGDVKVKFEQDNYVVATAEGEWVNRDPKYERNATVYIKRGDGSRSLVELRFEGMSRTLVFNK